jgi:hypothetical protein
MRMAAESRPAALPPAERTVGQLVAESLRFYGRRFWAVLVLGIPFLIVDITSHSRSVAAQTLMVWILGPFVCAAYVGASKLVLRTFWSWRAYGIALLVYLPFPLLLRFYVLPAVVWFALIGLAVPAAAAEPLGVRDALRRGLELGRADLLHAVGGLATLVLVFGISRQALVVLLNTQGNQAVWVAIVLADLVLSPLLYVGGAFLYLDQRARVE